MPGLDQDCAKIKWSLIVFFILFKVVLKKFFINYFKFETFQPLHKKFDIDIDTISVSVYVGDKTR